MEQIVKVQRRKIAVFVTIPAEYAKKIENVKHMKVTENNKGNLEYEAIRCDKDV